MHARARSGRPALLAPLVLAAGGCAAAAAPVAGAADEALAGGATTVFDDTPNAYSLAARNLREEHRASFFVGNSFFNKNWIAAPASVRERDGLGPLFNARSCSGCHLRDGRGRTPPPGEPLASMLLRISVPGRGPHGAPVPEPMYGDQIQGQALPGIPREADVLVDYELRRGAYEDGEPYELRVPRYRLERPGYGPPARGLLTSPRVAPALVGLGLLEAVPEETLRALADPDDRDGDGISGRTNVVRDVRTGDTAVGRFGWKAEQPTVLQQVAAAFLGDMGITSSLFPAENHTPRQRRRANRPSGGTPEIEDRLLGDIVLYVRALAVPARRRLADPAVREGARLFSAAGCAGCHVPRLETGATAALPELAGQVIFPYTDLLLHDMGPELADGRPSFAASGSEWRTPPLWGLGLLARVNGHTDLLHDGRARGVAEAILWHGGEAAGAREAFRRMSRAQRQALLAFLDSL